MNGLIFQGTPIFCRMVWGNEIFKPGPFYLGRYSKLVSWGALAYMSFMIIILCFPGTPDPTADTMNYGSVVFVATIAFSLAYYFCPKYGARYWFTYVSSVDYTHFQWTSTYFEPGNHPGDGRGCST